MLLCLLSSVLYRDAMNIKELEDATLGIAMFFMVDVETPMTVSQKGHLSLFAD